MSCLSMTIRELYKWAEENNALDLPLWNFDDDCFIDSVPKIDSAFCWDGNSGENIDVVIVR